MTGGLLNDDERRSDPDLGIPYVQIWPGIAIVLALAALVVFLSLLLPAA